MALHSGLSFPVGKVNFMTLYPLNFYEFLDAIGENMKLEQLEQGNLDILKPFHNELIELVKKYLFIGGMPEAVLSYATEKDLYKVRKIQNEILTSYQNDFSKHIPLNEQAKLKMLWSSIPTQLAKENKKFMYGKIEHGARAKEFENAIAWLESCGLIHKVYRIKKPDLPLSAYKDLAAFKIFVADVGLLSAMSNLDAKILLDRNDIFEEFKGALTEQYVLQQLLPYSDELTITYWSNESNTNEIDFVVQYENEVIPIEVKAATNFQAKSLKWYIEKYKPQKALRFSAADYKQNEVVTDYPLYAIGTFIK